MYVTNLQPAGKSASMVFVATRDIRLNVHVCKVASIMYHSFLCDHHDEELAYVIGECTFAFTVHRLYTNHFVPYATFLSFLIREERTLRAKIPSRHILALI